MAKFESAKWIIILLIYFTFYFLLTYAVFSLKLSNIGNEPNVDYTDPGFKELSNYFSYGGKCVPPGDLNLFPVFLTIGCRYLDADNNTCGYIKDCHWQDELNLFNVTIDAAKCVGAVDKGYYNITSAKEYCRSSGLQSTSMCKIFKCSWTNSSEFYDSTASLQGGIKGISSVYETAKFMTGFRTELGFKTYGWLFILVFTYIPLLALALSIYYLFVPF